MQNENNNAITKVADNFSLEKNLTYSPKSQPYLYQIITCFFFPFLCFPLQLIRY